MICAVGARAIAFEGALRLFQEGTKDPNLTPHSHQNRTPHTIYSENFILPGGTQGPVVLFTGSRTGRQSATAN